MQRVSSKRDVSMWLNNLKFGSSSWITGHLRRRALYATEAARATELGNTEMMRKTSHKIEVSVRVIADFIILNASLFAALLVNHTFFAPSANPGDTVVKAYLRCFCALSLAGIVTFAAMGFYSKGRAYTSRFKLLIVLQGSSLTFLIFGFAGFVTPFLGSMDNKALLIAWSIASGGLICARSWAAIWRRIGYVEVSHPEKNSDVTAVATRERILVIGGAGYIGSGLMRHLLENGYKVRVLDSFLYGHDAIAEWSHHPNVEIMAGDFRRVDVVVRAMRGVSTVVHLGAIVGDPACALDEDLTMETNVLATRMIAEVTKGQGIRRFIFASTCSVYGASDLLLDERSALNPVSLYARSKIACEQLLLSMKSSSFQPVILRFGTIYGLSGRTRFDLVVNVLTAKAYNDGLITVFGSDQWRPFLHVDDAARSVYLACKAPSQALADTIFNVGSDEQNYTLGEVGRLIHSIVPSARVLCEEKNVDRRNYRVDFSRVRRCLHFKPEWSLEMGVRQVLAAFESGRVKNYQDPHYSNVRFLSEEIGAATLRFAQDRWIENLMKVPTPAEVAAGG